MVRCDTQTCYLEHPSTDVMQKIARLASLTVDTSASNKLSPENKTKTTGHRKVIRLSTKNKTITANLKTKEYNLKAAATSNDAEVKLLCDRQKRVEALLKKIKVKLRSERLKKVRKRHFRNADTIAFDSQFSLFSTSKFSEDTTQIQPIEYEFPEQEKLDQLLCNGLNDLTITNEERFDHRIETIKTMATLYSRRGTKRRGGPKSSIKQEQAKTTPEISDRDTKDPFPLVCQPTQ